MNHRSGAARGVRGRAVRFRPSRPAGQNASEPPEVPLPERTPVPGAVRGVEQVDAEGPGDGTPRVAAPVDRESYVGNDIMSGTEEGTEKTQISLDPAKVAAADRMREQNAATETEEEQARRIKDA